MSTRTLSPAALRVRSARRHVSRALVVVPDSASADGASTDGGVPEWAQRWCGRSDWQLQRHADAGPFAAVAAARLDARVLVLRPVERERATSSPRVVAAVRSLPDDAPVVTDAAAAAACMGARLTIVHAVPRSFAERSVGLAGAVTHGQRLLEAAAGRATGHEPGLRVDCELLRMRPYELVGETLHANLLVVGGARTDRTAGEPGSGPGLVAHSALHHAPCPVLLTPR